MWSRTCWWVVVVMAGFGFLGGTEASAQAARDISSMSDAQIQRKVEEACRLKPGMEECRVYRQLCMTDPNGGVVDPVVCGRLEWTREDFARKQISKLKDKCELEDHDEGCVALRTSCREEGVTCEQVMKEACISGDYCDEQYLCTPSRLKSVCSGKTDLGATHMLMGVNYAMPQAEFGEHILAVSALGHGQTGAPGLGSSYVVDMNLGWYKGNGDNGMSYEFQALIGAGSRSGKHMFGVAGGGGFSGIAGGSLGFGWLLSVEAFAQASVGSGLEVLAYVRPSWVFSEDPRGDGADLAPFADEFTAGATLSWISKHKEGKFVAGTGYGLMLFYKEQLGFNMFGIGIGSAKSDVSQ